MEAQPIVPQTDNQSKRAQVLHWLLQPFRPTYERIAELTGVSERTVIRYAQKLQSDGLDQALTDGRINSGRRSTFTQAWERITEIKQQYPAYGGREIWAILTGLEGWPADGLPSYSRIDGYLSEQGLCHKKEGPKNDTKHYLQKPADHFNARVGMDGKYPFVTPRGHRIYTVNCYDWFSGAVYTETFPMGRWDPGYRPLDQIAWTGVLYRYINHIGQPEVLVMDNGAGQIPQDGTLPQVCRHAIELGVVVEYEPYGRPWKSGAVERYHGDLDKEWSMRKHEATSLEQGMRILRNRAWFRCAAFPRRQLHGKTVTQSFPIVPWPLDGEDAGPIPVEPIAKGGISKWGHIRCQRIVEQNGFCQLWGNDHVFLSDMLTGGYVRFDFAVAPHGEPGLGEVRDGKGELVATFEHYMDCQRPPHAKLTYNLVLHTYQGEGCDRVQNWNQEQENAFQHKMRKGRRAKEAYNQTGTVNPYDK